MSTATSSRGCAPPGPAANPHDLRLFDCLAPFFRAAEERAETTNWSKIPFPRLERDGVLDPATANDVLRDVEPYLATMADLGFNAVAVDDLAHLVPHPCYDAPLLGKLDTYATFYRRLFAQIKARGLRLFVLTDYMFFNPAIERHLRRTRTTPAALFVETAAAAFAAFPEIDGLVLRIGEGDGVDVASDFGSRLTIRRPREARALLDRLLPVCERRGKTLVFRTWTLGAYAVGDLIWNHRTYDAVFRGVTSPNLIVSLKYGDADFFRYLDLNPLFFHDGHRKIVELQCRREYEGMGEYPAFVGWLYARYLSELRERGGHVVGVYALQAGGWAPFDRLAFCANGSPWNELNTYVTAKLASSDASVEAIVGGYCRWRGIADPDGFLRLLALADRAIEEGLYIREIATKARYFRRVRVPPLLWVFWHNVTTGGLVADLHAHLIRDGAAAVAEGHRAVATVRAMVDLARQLGLPDDDLGFQLATFELLALYREVLLGLATPATHERLAALLPAYRRRYPRGYHFPDPSTAPRPPSRATILLFRLLLRDHNVYRRRDRLLLNRPATYLKTLAVRRRAALPRFVDRQGMPSDVLLR